MNESSSDDEIDGESTSDGEDKDLSFDEEEFSKMMREMMGMPPGSEFQNASLLGRSRGKVEELESESEPDDSQQIEELSRQMEAELRPTGVLDLNRRTGQVRTKTGSSKGKEVSHAAADSRQVAPDPEVEETTSIHLAKNLLDSIQSQAGLPGPGGNLLGMMGMNLPRDDRRS